MVSITWNKFKMFLYKSLQKFRAFIDSYWAKIKRDLQYQIENTLDWAAHLEHLQVVVLKEFDPTTTPNKKTLICYLHRRLGLFIQIQLDNWRRDLDLWEEIIEKAVNVETKTNL